MAGMRSLLLRYMLYDSLIRPSEWQFAPAFDEARRGAWEGALQRQLSQEGESVDVSIASLEAPRQIPVVPILAARALSARAPGAPAQSRPAGGVTAYEPIRPTAAALRSAADDNGADF